MDSKVYGLIGRSLKHSYSVPIHRELGNSAYRLIELEPGELAAFLGRDDLGGVNVTIPYKRDLLKFCRILSPEAQATGSVNTILRAPSGALAGYNTDICGLEYMARRTGLTFAGKKVVIFGSGGASRAAQYAARRGGSAETVIISRSGRNSYENLSHHYDAGILINATPVGMYPRTGMAPADIAPFTECTGLLDLIYNPRRTALLMQAEALGIPCSDGLPMLAAQARAAAELFMDREIGKSEIERIIEKLRREMTNIVLVGMPGCGKNTVGRALAAATGREIIDVDAEIVKKTGRPIPEIFAGSGEAAFRRLEREIIALAGKESGKIIITGGGAVKDERNYPPLHQNGRIYHLLRDPALLERAGRPLSEGTDLGAMLRERLPLYERFRDTAVDNSGAPEETAAAIWRDFHAHSGD